MLGWHAAPASREATEEPVSAVQPLGRSHSQLALLTASGDTELLSRVPRGKLWDRRALSPVCGLSAGPLLAEGGLLQTISICS